MRYTLIAAVAIATGFLAAVVYGCWEQWRTLNPEPRR